MFIEWVTAWLIKPSYANYRTMAINSSLGVISTRRNFVRLTFFSNLKGRKYKRQKDKIWETNNGTVQANDQTLVKHCTQDWWVTGSHADVERFTYQSKQRRAEVNGLVSGDRHVHTNEFLKRSAAKSGPKFTNDLMTMLRQFLDLWQSYDNCQIHKTFMTILGHILW